MASPLITALCALTSSYDPKVRLEFQTPRSPGQWDMVGFNKYTYTPGMDIDARSRVTMAQFDIMGQAAGLVSKSNENAQLQSYHVDNTGKPIPALRIVFPNTTASGSRGPSVDDSQREKLESLSTRYFEAGGEVENLPNNLSTFPIAVQVGWFTKAISRLTETVVRDEVVTEDDAPSIDA
jgi:hypothetical protein